MRITVFKEVHSSHLNSRKKAILIFKTAPTLTKNRMPSCAFAREASALPVEIFSAAISTPNSRWAIDSIPTPLFARFGFSLWSKVVVF